MIDISYKTLLIGKYNSLVNWEPDYEEAGIQVGPRQEDIDTVANAIKEIDPNWKTRDERILEYKRKRELQRLFPGIEEIGVKL